jgi:hypothetical protein
MLVWVKFFSLSIPVSRHCYPRLDTTSCLDWCNCFDLLHHSNSMLLASLVHSRHACNCTTEDPSLPRTAICVAASVSGDVGCSARQRHQRELPRRFKQEAQTPARLTGWNIQEIRRKLPSVRVQAIGWWQHRWSALLPW